MRHCRLTNSEGEGSNYHIVAVIIAENWSPSEIITIGNQIDKLFHFNMSPNKFVGFDEEAQIIFNRYIESILRG